MTLSILDSRIIRELPHTLRRRRAPNLAPAVRLGQHRRSDWKNNSGKVKVNGFLLGS